MAARPFFVPSPNDQRLVLERQAKFTWFSGFSTAQKQRSIQSLHEAITATTDCKNILEISSKSEDCLGRSLSAFTLPLTLPDGTVSTVECAFQGSKIFDNGGPYQDLYGMNSRRAKKDPRVREASKLIGFRLVQDEWPKDPLTGFYDWLYIQALTQNRQLAADLLEHDAFTDIEFNPSKSLNCQARSAAMYVSLVSLGKLEAALNNRVAFLDLYSPQTQSGFQPNLI